MTWLLLLSGWGCIRGGIAKSQEKWATEDEMVGWHHWLNGHEFERAPRIGDGQGGLACCSPWGHKESDTTERLNWLTKLSREPGRSQPPTTVSAENNQGAVMRAPNPPLLGWYQQSPHKKPELLPHRKETSPPSQPSGERPLPPANYEAAFTLQLKMYQRKPAVRELNNSSSFLTVPKISISPSKFICHTKKCKISTLMRNDNKRHKQWDDTDVTTVWQGF